MKQWLKKTLFQSQKETPPVPQKSELGRGYDGMWWVYKNLSIPGMNFFKMNVNLAYGLGMKG